MINFPFSKNLKTEYKKNVPYPHIIIDEIE